MVAAGGFACFMSMFKLMTAARKQMHQGCLRTSEFFLFYIKMF
jgi:hypothetical protein